MPSSLGVTVLEGARPTPHSRLCGAGYLNLSGVKAGGPRPGAQEMASCHHLSTRLSVPPSQMAHHFSARDQAAWNGAPSAYPGGRDGLLAPRAGRKGDGLENKQEGD